MKLNRKQWILIIMIACLLLCSVLMELMLPKIISESNLAVRLQAPSMQHFFGTDAFGRDVFVRTIVAAKLSILSTIVIVVVAGGFGIFVGMISGYMGGLLDEVLMAICDLFLAFPQMLIAIAIAGILGGGLHNAMIALAISDWMLFARLARSATLKEKSELYVTAAKFAGLSDIEILLRHILPNIRNVMIVTLTLNFANMLLSLAGETANHTIRIGTEQFTASLDSALEWNGWFTVRYGIGETLFKVEDNMEITPWLVSNAENIDTQTWKLTLRENIKFSDSTTMDAKSVVDNLHHVAQENARAAFLKDAEYEIDGNSITIKTVKPRATLLSDLSDPMFAILNLNSKEDRATMPIGTGPYTVKTFS